MRLLCLPHAGGGTATFFPWSQEIDPDVEVCALVLPGRDHRRSERAVESIEELAEDFAAAIISLTDRPFALFGHSLGAALGYEVALRLEATSGNLQHLFVAARGAPDTPPPSHRLTDLDDAAFVGGIQARYDAVPAAIVGDPDVLALFLPVLRADLRLHEGYCAPCRPLRCPITAVGGVGDPAVRLSDLDRWSTFTQGGFRRHLLPGGHFFVRESRPALLSLIVQGLGQPPRGGRDLDARAAQ